jgi:histidinol-phosphate aminotransferase
VNDREDPRSLLDLAAKEKARLVFFANPDNPMGSFWPSEHVEAMIAQLPAGTLLFLDEAYGEFAPEGTLPPLDVSNSRVLRFRTFSKAYGMAGLRVGYAIGHPSLISAFDKVRNHFGVTRLGQEAAIAALADQNHLQGVITAVEAAKRRIAGIARANGLKPLASATNFVAVDCGRDETHARAILNALAARGVFVRMPGVAPLNRCIRVTAGTDADLQIFGEELADVLSELG